MEAIKPHLTQLTRVEVLQLARGSLTITIRRDAVEELAFVSKVLRPAGENKIRIEVADILRGSTLETIPTIGSSTWALYHELYWYDPALVRRIKALSVLDMPLL